MFTTPRRPFDILSVFPELAVLAKTATRLHPRRGLPEATASSVAGPMLWPTDEMWPTCQIPHLVEVRREATAQEASLFQRAEESRRQHLADLNARHPELADDPDSSLGRLMAAQRDGEPSRPRPVRTVTTWQPAIPAAPVPMVPVVQLRAADVPEAQFPAGTDLLQILWCPFRHPDVPGMHEYYSGPAPKVLWRNAAELSEVVRHSDECMGEDRLVLKPCVVSPERVTEYPDIEDLPEPLQSRVTAWQESLSEDSAYDYRNDLSVAPGLKTGGWPYWPHCPRPVECNCGSEMNLLLTIPNGEHGVPSWTPIEEESRDRASGRDEAYRNPTGFMGARDELLIFVCRDDPRHDMWIALE